MDKASYIRGMAAFYELGLVDVLAQVFVQGYIHSILRSSVVPVAMRGAGFKVGPLVQTLTHHVLTGQRPADVLARLFLRCTRTCFSHILPSRLPHCGMAMQHRVQHHPFSL